MSPENYGLLFAILSPFFTSVSAIFKAGGVKIFDPITFLVISSAMGAVLLIAFARIFKEKFSFEKIKKHKKDLFLSILLRGVLGELFLTLGLSQTEAIKAIFLSKIEVYFVLIISWIFLKEKIQSKHFLLLIIHVIGAIILSTGGKFQTLQAHLGDFFIVLAVFFFACSYTFSKKTATNIGSVYSNAISLTISAIIFLPFMLRPIAFKHFDSQTGWIYLVTFVILFNVLGLTFWFISLKHVKAWIVSSLRYIGPVLGAPAAYFVLGETLNPMQIFGAIIVITTSLLIVREHFKTKDVLIKQSKYIGEEN